MSVSPDPQVDMQVIEQERRKLSRRLDEVSRLCEADVPPGTFYGEMLKRLLESLAAPAGAVWTRTPQGNLQLQFQVNLREVGLDKSEEARQSHEELLRLAVTTPSPMHLLPHSGVGQPAQEGKAPPGNPTDFLLLLVPIMMNGQTGGLIEVWQSPNRPLNAVPGFLQYMSLMADLCTRYQRNQMLGMMKGQEQVYTQIEQFARNIHGSLNPIEVAYLIANEGRRLVECDRVSVAVRYARKPRIEAISGADIVERRSNLVQLMQKLCFEVMKWGEKLVFTGVKDDSLPPKVLDALDKYLEESASKLLVIMPLRDEREKTSKKLPRSALMMEAFDPPAEPLQLVQRLDVVAKHAVSALYNAVEHRRIPMRFVWMPLARLQEGLGGQGQAIAMAIAVGITLLISALVFIPYPLKMDSEGKLVPQVRRYVYYPGMQGTITRFEVRPGENVTEKRVLAHLNDIELAKRLEEWRREVVKAQKRAVDFRQIAGNLPDAQAKEKTQLLQEATNLEDEAKSLERRFDKYMELVNAQNTTGPDGDFVFVVKAPEFTREELDLLGEQAKVWTILNTSFKEDLTNRAVRPSDPILRLGAKNGPWELEMKIPQKHIGQVYLAFEKVKARMWVERKAKLQAERNTEVKDDDPALVIRDNELVLDVDFLLRSDPTKIFRGKLHRNRIGGEAAPSNDESSSNTGEAEPMVLSYVRIEGEDIPESDRVPPEMLLSGTEVHAKVRCGDRAMGYSLFYGVWEFLFEKVVFFF